MLYAIFYKTASDSSNEVEWDGLRELSEITFFFWQKASDINLTILLWNWYSFSVTRHFSNMVEHHCAKPVLFSFD